MLEPAPLPIVLRARETPSVDPPLGRLAKAAPPVKVERMAKADVYAKGDRLAKAGPAAKADPLAKADPAAKADLAAKGAPFAKELRAKVRGAVSRDVEQEAIEAARDAPNPDAQAVRNLRVPVVRQNRPSVAGARRRDRVPNCRVTPGAVLEENPMRAGNHCGVPTESQAAKALPTLVPLPIAPVNRVSVDRGGRMIQSPALVKRVARAASAGLDRGGVTRGPRLIGGLVRRARRRRGSPVGPSPASAVTFALRRAVPRRRLPVPVASRRPLMAPGR